MKYEIKGGELPVVICYLENGETMITERGSMSWMSPNMKMETTSNGGIGKALGRMFAGEALFQNRYTAEDGNGLIAFATSFPGEIRPWEIGPQLNQVWNCPYSSRKNWEPVSLAVKDLSCRGCPDMEPPSLSLMEAW